MEKAYSITLMVMLLVVMLQGFSVSNAQTSSNDKILITITKNSVVYLSSQDRMVRAHVEITDYSPVDGDLFMKIVKTDSGKTVSESKIIVRHNSGNVWSTEIAYMVDNQNPNDSDSLIGSYEIQISPENGAYQGSATFQVLLKPIPGPKIQSITAADPTDSNTAYSNGDTITIAFSEPTNQPKVETKADLDRLFSFSQNLGDDYTGIWTDPSTLTISIVDSNGATPPIVGSFRITLKESGNLTNAEGTSLVLKVTSPVLVGTFGTLKETPVIDKQKVNTKSSAKNTDVNKQAISKTDNFPTEINSAEDFDRLSSKCETYECGLSLMNSKLQYLQQRGYDPWTESIEISNEKVRNERYQQQENITTGLIIIPPIILVVTIAIILVNKRKKLNAITQGKSDRTTLILSLVLGLFGMQGIGQIYVGHVGRGIGISILFLILLVWGITSIYSYGMFLLFICFIIFIAQIADARNLCREYNERLQAPKVETTPKSENAPSNNNEAQWMGA